MATQVDKKCPLWMLKLTVYCKLSESLDLFLFCISKLLLCIKLMHAVN